MKNITPYSNIISFYGAGFPAVRYFSFFVAMFIPVLLSLGVSVGKTTEITYDIAFEGLDDRGIEFKLRGISDMEELRDKPPAGIGLLRSRAERDRKKFIEYLRSRGWYSAEIGVRVDRDLIPIMVTFDVDIGPPYLLKDVHIQAVEEAADLKMPSAEELDLVPGKRFEAKALLSAQKKTACGFKTSRASVSFGGRPARCRESSRSYRFGGDARGPGTDRAARRALYRGLGVYRRELCAENDSVEAGGLV